MTRIVAALLAAALVVVPAAAQAPKKSDPRQVSEAQKQLVNAGCKLHYDEAAPGAPCDLVWFPPRTSNASLARLVGLAARLPHLKTIDLGETQVTNDGLQELARLPNLESVYLDQTGVTDDGVKALAGLPRLAWLDLNGTKVTAKSAENLAACKALHHLFVNGANLGPAEVKHIATLSKLRTLEVGSVPDPSIADLARLSDLKEVRLAKVGPTTGEELGKLKALETVKLRGGFTALSADGWTAIAGLTELKSVGVGNFDWDDWRARRAWNRNGKPVGLPASVATLGQVRGLKKLDLMGLPIGDDALKPVGKLTGLEELNLSYTLVTLNDCSAHFADLGKLQVLYARDTNITDRGLRSLEKLHELRWLYLYYTAVTETGVNRLQKALPRCTIYWKPGKGDHHFRIPSGYGK